MPDLVQTAWDGWRPDDPLLEPAFELWRSGDYDSAEALFRLNNDPPSDDMMRGLGSVHWTRGNFQEAHACFAKAICLGPRRAMNWSNLGLVLRDLARFEQALMVFDVALGLDDRYEPAWNERGNVLYDMGRADRALSHYHRALSLDNSRAVVHHNLGMCLLALGDLKPAREAFETALKIDPGYSWSISMLESI